VGRIGIITPAGVPGDSKVTRFGNSLLWWGTVPGFWFLPVYLVMQGRTGEEAIRLWGKALRVVIIWNTAPFTWNGILLILAHSLELKYCSMHPDAQPQWVVTGSPKQVLSHVLLPGEVEIYLLNTQTPLSWIQITVKAMMFGWEEWKYNKEIEVPARMKTVACMERWISTW